MSGGGLAGDALAGLWASPPSLPARWFYDERGSRLFDEITRLPEYYPTRRETEILRAHAAEIARLAAAETVVELGAGMSTKTRILLDACAARHFVPVDVSGVVLAEAAAAIARDYPHTTVEPVVADFAEPPSFPGRSGARLVLFLGGTIGNFDDAQRATFLARQRAALAPGDHFLLGADLVKAPSRLLAAYDDSVGVTAEFNRNLIEVLRATLDAEGLYVDDFQHAVRWDPERHRIEMWLRARRDVTARFHALGRDWKLPAGDGMLTEISVKFRVPDLHAELVTAGFAPVRTWTDAAGDFSLTLARAH
ncbi:L-histidine N(alpha)-methyltransferase [Asanoa iriomotensis]|uniref:Histidine N-alpha-methyltransferase n=1 Tax=Asanoa iriomotensis TaxID=234613 RepID=A0ABQ4BXF9_9ACTN|nr:L-histidine N(alpha)-methyltransferase [Asanoa iriomotensis]GIF55206.1 histidine N-alpha-methyltransferase [Asanoa iriomotensis]